MTRSSRSKPKSCTSCRYFEVTGISQGWCNNPEIPLAKTTPGDICSLHKPK